VDPVPDPLLLRKSGSAGNRTRTSGGPSLCLHIEMKAGWTLVKTPQTEKLVLAVADCSMCELAIAL
jgi:hypothetical protein